MSRGIEGFRKPAMTSVDRLSWGGRKRCTTFMIIKNLGFERRPRTTLNKSKESGNRLQEAIGPSNISAIGPGKHMVPFKVNAPVVNSFQIVLPFPVEELGFSDMAANRRMTSSTPEEAMPGMTLFNEDVSNVFMPVPVSVPTFPQLNSPPRTPCIFLIPKLSTETKLISIIDAHVTRIL
jgi:hypothetical protein